MNLPARVILSRKHPLARVDQLTMTDLKGWTLLVTPGDYDRLNGNCPGVHLKTVQYYDVIHSTAWRTLTSCSLVRSIGGRFTPSW